MLDRLGQFARMAQFAAGAFVVLIAAAPASAMPPEGALRYVVKHSILGDIGTMTYAVTRDGERLVARSEGDLTAKVLIITVRRQTFSRTEVFEGGQLLSYQSFTTDNGKDTAVRTEPNGDGLTVESTLGTFEAPPGTLTTNPWNPDIVNASKVIDAKTGEVHDIEVTGGATEQVEVIGGSVEARHYKVSGGSNLRDIWFDADGRLVKFTTSDGSTPVDVILDLVVRPKRRVPSVSE